MAKLFNRKKKNNKTVRFSKDKEGVAAEGGTKGNQIPKQIPMMMKQKKKHQQPHDDDANRLVKAVAALDAYSVDGIMEQWNPNGVYDNPMVGPPVKGLLQLRRAMEDLVDLLQSNNTHLQVNKVTEADNHCVVEWTPLPPDGREGLHIARFDDDGYLQHVRVYVRQSYDEDDVDDEEEEDKEVEKEVDELEDEEETISSTSASSTSSSERRHRRVKFDIDMPGMERRHGRVKFEPNDEDCRHSRDRHDLFRRLTATFADPPGGKILRQPSRRYSKLMSNHSDDDHHHDHGDDLGDLQQGPMLLESPRRNLMLNPTGNYHGGGNTNRVRRIKETRTTTTVTRVEEIHDDGDYECWGNP